MGRTPETIVDALFAAANEDAGEYVFHLDEQVVRLGSARLLEQALDGARRLAALGVEPGDSVGLLGPNRPEWIVWAFATWIAGARLVPVQFPLRVREPATFRKQLDGLVRTAGCRRVLAEPEAAALLPDEVAVAWNNVRGGTSQPAQPPEEQDVAVVQYTSGSTAEPKGVLLRHAAVTAQMAALKQVYCYEDGGPRTVVNWAPFFHDLGLFANVVQPVFTGATVHQLPTERFARDPAEWLRLIAKTEAVVTVAPSSAFGSALSAVRRRAERIDLGSLDVAYFAAESIDVGVAAQLLDKESGLRIRPEALGGTYGMAEAVMGAAFPRPGTGLRLDHISRDLLAGEGIADPDGGRPIRSIASSGPPVTELRIWEGGEEAPERHVGEIQLRGRSLMSGYIGGCETSPFEDGWLRTGDLGYMADGDLFVTGRAKDVIIAMGHNYHPEDFEWAAAQVDGVRPGRCVAFSRPGTEEVVVLVEAREGSTPEDFEVEVDDRIADTVGVRPSEVIVVSPGTIEKTTSGKLRRAAMRELYATGALEAPGPVFAPRD